MPPLAEQSDAIEEASVNKSEARVVSSRLLVQRTIYDHFVEKLAAGVRKVAMGNGMDPKVYVSPCASKKQQERVLDYVQIGKDVGGEISAQGNQPSEGRHA
jgi:acyl-CoA reductase-like NAD-dependent aldehyde dehydrogenase